jgi:SAM-dependent methyltransferase
LLGVTPELACCAWDPPLELVAVDRSAAMIAAVWPGDTPARRAVCGDWFDLPFEPATIDVAMGDGCFSLLDYPGGYRQLGRSLARVVAGGGLFCIRLFCRPERAELPDAVFEDLFARRIANFHAFKWRLAMALHGDDVQRGVVLADIWNAFRERVPAPPALAAHTGWPLPEISTIDNYRDAPASYTYPTVAEVRRVLDPDFELLGEQRGSYALAERCPELSFCRR